MRNRKFELVIFGATGFTGKYVVEEVAKFLRGKKVETFSWAVAGRSKAKLAEVLAEATKFSGYDVTAVDMLEVDVENLPSIHAMAREAVVLLNCVGPYRFFGEAVVEACIEEGTHHVDISGEPQFLEKTQLLYHQKAEKKGVYVVGACGWDCVPTDIGVTFLKDTFKGDLNSVEMYVELDPAKTKKTVLHYGSWESLINIIANIGELKLIRSQLFPNPLPKPTHELRHRPVLHYNEIVNAWCIPFMGTDKSVVERSERFFFEKEGKRPVQINTYFKQQNLAMSIFMIIGFAYVGVMSQFRIGRHLLTKYPRLLSLGAVSHAGPTREQADVPFTFTLVGEGWDETLTEGTDQHSKPPNKKLTVKVKGRNPGYGSTCVCMIQSALTILRESSKMPSTGGVYTTAAAFAKTSIVERLHKTGLTFEVVDA